MAFLSIQKPICLDVALSGMEAVSGSLGICVLLQPAVRGVEAIPTSTCNGVSFTVAYQFLAIEDVDEDKVQDVIFAFKASNSSSSFNRSCLDEGSCFRNGKPCSKRAVIFLLVLVSEATMGLGEKTRLARWGAG